MAEKYLLPALKNTPEIESDQLWELFADPYDFLLNNLKLYYEPNVSIFDGGSNATPHIYEQMLIFHKAFFRGIIRNTRGQFWSGGSFSSLWHFRGSVICGCQWRKWSCLRTVRMPSCGRPL